MIKFEHCEVVGWEHAVRGMRNPMNSWDKSDSVFNLSCDYICCEECPERGTPNCVERLAMYETTIGQNDHNLMMHLRDAGTDHRKFMRMINVYVDITAPLYWWKEFDTYKVGTVANSCSTMHKIHAKEFELGDFSTERLRPASLKRFMDTITTLNFYRNLYMNGGVDDNLGGMVATEFQPRDKEIWWQMIQLLPSSYNQRRTIMMNYEVLANIYKSRKNHKLDEWRTFCSWIEELPYSEIIVGELEEDIPSLLTKNLVIPADELRAGLLSGISADPNAAVVDAINGIIEEDEQNAT